MMLTLILGILVLVAAAVGYFWGKNAQKVVDNEDIARLVSERDVQKANAENSEKLLASLKESYETQLKQIKENSERQLDSLKEMNRKQVEDQLALIKEQMKATSETVLKERQKEATVQFVAQYS